MYIQHIYKSNIQHTTKKQVAIFADNEKEHVEALAKRLNFDLDMWIRCVYLCKHVRHYSGVEHITNTYVGHVITNTYVGHVRHYSWV